MPVPKISKQADLDGWPWPKDRRPEVNGGNTPLSRYANRDLFELYWAYEEGREWYTKDNYMKSCEGSYGCRLSRIDRRFD